MNANPKPKSDNLDMLLFHKTEKATSPQNQDRFHRVTFNNASDSD